MGASWRAVDAYQRVLPAACAEHPGSRIAVVRGAGPSGHELVPRCTPADGAAPHALAWQQIDAGPARAAGLSTVELEVLLDAANGYTVAETAERRHRSRDTVKSQRTSMMLKLAARNTAHAVALALARGLIGSEHVA